MNDRLLQDAPGLLSSSFPSVLVVIFSNLFSAINLPLIRVFILPKHETTAYPCCGHVFECKLGSVLICHCSDVQLSPEQLDYIADKWDGCLCHSCLLNIKKNWQQISGVEN